MTKEQLSDYSWGAPLPPGETLNGEKKDISINTFLDRMKTVFETGSGVSVTPENCMRSPTVHAIITAVSRRISISPVHVFKKEVDGVRERKVRQPDHHVEKLLARPNEFQTRTSYWMDATSSLLRYGRFHAAMMAGNTGPTRLLRPMNAGAIQIKEGDDGHITFEASMASGRMQTFDFSDMHYVRSAARDFLRGDSPIMDIKEAIAMEIAVEQYGSSFFGNGALPLIFFNFMEGSQGFKDKEAEDNFIASFQESFGGKKRFKGMLVPKGMETDIQETDQEKTQFNDTRKLLRTIIAGAYGVPPHLVGDLERATFNNVEQQDSDFVINVVLPYAQMFESAMERDFLSPKELTDGYIIRFNLDAVQRADFKSRQAGLLIQRRAGVINPNDWRERENMNPISEADGGETYLTEMNMTTEELRELEAAADPQPNRGEE